MAAEPRVRVQVPNVSERSRPRGSVEAPNQRNSTSLSTPIVVKIRRVTELKNVSANSRSDRWVMRRR